MIQELTATPELNKTYLGKVQRITDFGAFVEIMPGTDGLLHVSEIAQLPRQGRARRAEGRPAGAGEGDQHRPDRQDSPEPQGPAPRPNRARSPVLRRAQRLATRAAMRPGVRVHPVVRTNWLVAGLSRPATAIALAAAIVAAAPLAGSLAAGQRTLLSTQDDRRRRWRCASPTPLRAGPDRRPPQRHRRHHPRRRRHAARPEPRRIPRRQAGRAGQAPALRVPRRHHRHLPVLLLADRRRRTSPRRARRARQWRR